ncbi:hypothetical protein COX75_00465 [bacterium (Candidatus Gribaldobacteria) CG_4_10_14_0_2_um_filter_33_15]|nr:MAG: hypothetical protein COX75_00465 [bacterium (Candidatus Gribaldobacteria) CG_4_10_14_0_2_um_filter_33_15]
MIKNILFIVISYFVSSILGGYLLAKILKKDGFGKNDLPGAIGTARQLGFLAGILVGAFDTLKSFLIILIGILLGFETNILVLGGMAVIAGHNWPIFFKFRGGGGISPSVGIIILLLPKEAIIMLIIGLISAFLYKVIFKKMLNLKISMIQFSASITFLTLPFSSLYFKELQELIFLSIGIVLLGMLKSVQWKIKPIKNL